MVFARRNPTQQGTQHVLADRLILAQGFVSRDGDLAFRLVAQPRPLHPHFPVGKLNAPPLRTVMPDFAAGLAGRTRTCDLFGAQSQYQLQRLYSDFMDDGIDHLARTLDQVDDGEQNLSIGFAELLDNGRRLVGGARDDLIGFTQGGWLLSDSRFSSTGF